MPAEGSDGKDTFKRRYHKAQSFGIVLFLFLKIKTIKTLLDRIKGINRIRCYLFISNLLLEILLILLILSKKVIRFYLLPSTF